MAMYPFRIDVYVKSQFWEALFPSDLTLTLTLTRTLNPGLYWHLTLFKTLSFRCFWWKKDPPISNHYFYDTHHEMKKIDLTTLENTVLQVFSGGDVLITCTLLHSLAHSHTHTSDTWHSGSSQLFQTLGTLTLPTLFQILGSLFHPNSFRYLAPVSTPISFSDTWHSGSPPSLTHPNPNPNPSKNF